MLDALGIIFRRCVRENKLPGRWKISAGIFLKKIKDPTEGKHIRPIALQSCLYKIFSRILADNLRKFTRISQNIWSDNQRGFRETNGCVVNVNLLRCAVDNARRNQTALRVVFTDIANAFGSVEHCQQMKVLAGLGIPKSVCDLVWICITGSTMVTEIDGESHTIKFARGLPQGDPLSPILFVLLLEPLLRLFKKEDIHYKMHTSMSNPTLIKVDPMAFADDFAIPANSDFTVDRALGIMNEYLKFFHLFLVPEKCSALVINKDLKAEVKPFMLNGKPIPIISNLAEKYLGGAVDKTFSWNSTKVATKLDDILAKIHLAKIPLWIKLKCLREWFCGALQFHFAIQPLKKSDVHSFDAKVCETIKSWFHLFPGHTMFAFRVERVRGGEGVIDTLGLQEAAMVRTCDYLLNSDKVDPDARKVFLFGVSEAAKRCGVSVDDFWRGNFKISDRVKNIWARTAKILYDYRLTKLDVKAYWKNRNFCLFANWVSLGWQGRAMKHRDRFGAILPQLLDQPMGDRYLRWYLKALHDTLFNCHRKGASKCPCGDHNSQRHQLSFCANNKSRYTSRHDSVVSFLSEFLEKELSLTVIKDTPLPSYIAGRTRHNRLDIVAWSKTEIFVFDVAICDPSRLNIRYTEKIRRYSRLLPHITQWVANKESSPYPKAKVVPLIWDVSGACNPKTYGFFAHLLKSKKLSKELGKKVAKLINIRTCQLFSNLNGLR